MSAYVSHTRLAGVKILNPRPGAGESSEFFHSTAMVTRRSFACVARRGRRSHPGIMCRRVGKRLFETRRNIMDGKPPDTVIHEIGLQLGCREASLGSGGLMSTTVLILSPSPYCPHGLVSPVL